MRFVVKILIPIVIAALGYYLFILPYDLRIKFTTKTLPGDVIETLRIWNRSLDSAQIVEVDSFRYVRQRLVINEREYFYQWNFDRRDSITSVAVDVSEPTHGIRNKIAILYGEPPVEADGKVITKGFYDVLRDHLRLTNVRSIGEAQLKSELCLCRAIEKTQMDKGLGMMQHYLLISTSIQEKGLKPDGYPTVRVTKWSHSDGMVKFEFCFPVLRQDSLPEVDGLVYREFNNQRALKAEYNGNYITSDRAWYALYHYAGEHGYKVSGLPVEVFIDNPNFGKNELQWKAEIFLPVESKK